MNRIKETQSHRAKSSSDPAVILPLTGFRDLLHVKTDIFDFPADSDWLFLIDFLRDESCSMKLSAPGTKPHTRGFISETIRQAREYRSLDHRLITN